MKELNLERIESLFAGATKLSSADWVSPDPMDITRRSGSAPGLALSLVVSNMNLKQISTKAAYSSGLGLGGRWLNFLSVHGMYMEARQLSRRAVRK